MTAPAAVTCRFCDTPLTTTFVDLGFSPLANSYLTAEDLHRPSTFYPLHAYLCTECFLVQLPEAESPEEIFSRYAYFSSVSTFWVEHARRYADAMVERLDLGEDSLVVEIASNDAYLLQHFHARDIPVLGIEPAANIARAARDKGIPTRTAFFGRDLARELASSGVRPDLLVGNNVLAHVPALNDFVAGLKLILAEDGVVTMEFPHLLRLLQQRQFDTIYHEHFSYFSFSTVRRVFARHGLVVFDVEELPTHGGSLRIFARHLETEPAETDSVGELLRREEASGLLDPATYADFAREVETVKRDLLSFLIDARERGETVAGYGAPAKGNTLLNYCGVGPELLPYTVDRSEHKQGLYLPGTGIPIHAPEKISEDRPEHVLILPWNLKDEITGQMSDVKSWGGKFWVAIPGVECV